MFKILEIYFSILFLNIEDIDPWKIVCSSVIHGDGCTCFRVNPRIAIIFDMALGAEEIGISPAEYPNGPKRFTIPLKFDFLYSDLPTFILIVWVGSFPSVNNGLD